jgi:excisionase family DNA binding protein
MTTKATITWLSIKQIAKQLNVHPATIRRQAKRKSVPIAKVGTAHRIREDHLPLLMKVDVS